jgi:hypothetical protein
VNDGLFRIAAARKERHGSFADPPPAHAGTDLDDFAGTLKSEHRGGARWRRIESLALQKIRSVHGRGTDAKAKLLRTEGGRRSVA